MKVKELIAALLEYDMNADVSFLDNSYYDYDIRSVSIDESTDSCVLSARGKKI